MLKNKTKNTKGFTIIELLIVLAVIVLLVAIVFISLTIVRTKAGNSVIKNDVDQLRKYAEVMYTENGMRGYCADIPESCFEPINPRLTELKDDIEKRSKVKEQTSMSCKDDSFCVHVNLSDGDYYCVDSASNQTTGKGIGGSGRCNLDSLNSNYLQCQ